MRRSDIPRRPALPLILAAFVLAPTAQAQVAPETIGTGSGGGIDEDTAQRDVRERNEGTELDLRTGFVGSGIQLLADSDGTAVSLAASRSWDSSAQRSLSFNTASVVLSAPISDQKKHEGLFVSDGGLPGAISIQGALTMAISGNPPSPGTPEARRRLHDRQQALCQRAVRRKAKARDDCNVSIVSTDSGEPLADVWADSPVWLLGISAAIGRQTFDYRDIATFAKRDTRRTEYSFSGSVGVNPNSRPLYLGTGYEYRRRYRAADDRTLCPPAAGGGPQECFTGAFAEPQREVDSALFAVVRWQGDLGLGNDRLPVGLAVKATYDTRDDVFGLSVPVYLFPGVGGGLRGGVRFDWQDADDKDDRFRFGVFIGAPFSLFGG